MSKLPSIFYDPAYLTIQGHKKLEVYETDDFKAVFALAKNLAISLPQGLFGSIVRKKRTVSFPAFEAFWREVHDGLAAHEINRAEIIHPPDIYGGYVPFAWLGEVGFSRMYADINHHIPLKDFHLHKMEEKKLKQLAKLKFKTEKLPATELKATYDFLNDCREEKGLKLNVSYDRLSALFEAFPDRYDIFMAYLDGAPASAVVTIEVASDVVYYFLPGTLESAKQHSPMVGLLAEIVKHFSKSHTYLDLGVSSVEGKPQEGLITFKERMGGVRSSKSRFYIKV
jgi:hypothetical protein